MRGWLSGWEVSFWSTMDSSNEFESYPLSEEVDEIERWDWSVSLSLFIIEIKGGFNCRKYLSPNTVG